MFVQTSTMLPADGLQVIHVVEAGDGLAVGGGEVERVRDLPERLRRQPAVVLLSGVERGHDRRAAHRILRGQLLDLVVERRVGH